jgi:hypothetical protein
LPEECRGLVNVGRLMDQGLVRDDEANAFFTAAEIFAQLQDSEPSSQCVDFNPAGRFVGIGGEFDGFNTIAGPTG